MDRSIHTSWWDHWWPAETCWIFDKETHSLICTLTVFLTAQFHTSNTFSYAQELWFLNYYFYINTLLIHSHSGMSVCGFAVIPCGYCSQKSFKVWYFCDYECGKFLYKLCYLCKVKVMFITSGSVYYVLMWKIWILMNCSSASWSPTTYSVRGNSGLFRYSTHSQYWHSVQVANLTLTIYTQICNYTRFILLSIQVY